MQIAAPAPAAAPKPAAAAPKPAAPAPAPAPAPAVNQTIDQVPVLFLSLAAKTYIGLEMPVVISGSR